MSRPTSAADPLAAEWIRRRHGRAASEAVHGTIREAILSGKLRPSDRLGEEDLARRFAVSRTPVREALLRLEAERLAVRVPRRGLLVAEVSEDEVLELYVVRGAVDGLAARLAAEAARPTDVAHLRWLNDQFRAVAQDGDADRLAEVNLEFHEAVGRVGRNGVLMDFMRSIHDRVRRFPGTTFSVAKRADEAADEHATMIEAISARDPLAAEEAARRHMARAMEIRIGMLQSAVTDTPRDGVAR